MNAEEEEAAKKKRWDRKTIEENKQPRDEM